MELLEQPPRQPLRLEAGRCLLFVYGLLQLGQRPPRSVNRAWADTVRGLLYDLGRFPGAVRVGEVDRHFHGFVLEIAEAELYAELDPFEEVDRGQYRRIRTVTGSGFAAWIYEYARPLPREAAGPLDAWPAK